MPGNCEGLRGEGFWGFSVKGFGVPGLGCGCVGIWGFQVFIRTTQVPKGSHNLDENRLGQIGIGYGVRGSGRTRTLHRLSSQIATEHGFSKVPSPQGFGNHSLNSLTGPLTPKFAKTYWEEQRSREAM